MLGPILGLRKLAEHVSSCGRPEHAEKGFQNALCFCQAVEIKCPLQVKSLYSGEKSSFGPFPRGGGLSRAKRLPTTFQLSSNRPCLDTGG